MTNKYDASCISTVMFKHVTESNKKNVAVNFNQNYLELLIAFLFSVHLNLVGVEGNTAVKIMLSGFEKAKQTLF